MKLSESTELELGPIILLIDLKPYKDKIIPGREWGFGGLEYEIHGPISARDIRIMQKREIDRMRDFVTLTDGRVIGADAIPQWQDSYKRFLCPTPKVKISALKRRWFQSSTSFHLQLYIQFFLA